MGVDVTRLRRERFVVSSLLTGVVVAASGAIGFVGLMVPHLCRLHIGGDHRRLLRSPRCRRSAAATSS
ncbi:iron chelate uptake ABC transporter family permease subunit [Streptomyces sp. NRRL S-1813]|uniref:iron chelate uptake ABC transporter family permease subunit n=1 Tax=Streptomyces sp. NRRL S-1813 TaxID=1463888 RepID=UPI002D2193C8|nr:iron chelate uptake ABC transporter family permease subunit [Streptomyces sp. NRRL S-1813]